MRRKTNLLRTAIRVLILGALVSAPDSAQAQGVFFDGFEAPSLDPFWTFTSPANAGSMSFDSSVAHTGTQSVQLSSLAYGGNAYLTHMFPSAVYGTVDVYVYDPLIPAIGYKQLWISSDGLPSNQSANPGNSYLMWYDWATLQTVLYYPVDPFDPNTTWAAAILAPAYSSPGWRRWTISTSPTKLTIQIDGATVFTRSLGYAFNAVSLNNCCIAGYANFDDFSFTQASVYQVALLYDPAKPVRSGATIPIRLQVADGSGQNISSSNLILHAISVTRTSASVDGDVQDAGNANPDNDFRYDATLAAAGGYIFNLKTAGLMTGSYNLNFTVGGDSAVYTVPFQVK
jgi:hypothetical protein